MTKPSEPPWREWRHVVKLDPDRPLADEVLAAIHRAGTDAVLLGGTQRITYEKVNALLGRLRRLAPDLPVWQEVSTEEAVVDGVDGYAVPVVLNAGNPRWLIGEHVRAVLRYRPFIDWSRVLVEGYLVLNPDCAVAELTQADTTLTVEQAAAYAVAGEALFSMPVIYLEYSGAYGNLATVKEICRLVEQAHLFYGGGIDSYEKAAEMGAHADTIIVGNALYGENWRAVLTDTVRAVKG
ncbi:heptaprenylglyceryl phosphate synthase [Tumebacillus permanentifrigoris]|uniref:Heptaprenylglyceryl phosphate synthase n=1 Tax=Tumebacillus permanentifrigoris TaxID=378543 RepID=A0A316DAQ2_9BACL|nr:heptaprenylglyceryl phosphate synthase [Tumebacillus permanentifrigoris]PWK14882.1 putative glycerol-1-phosphate prenyltransferase [Tumebacillus permanentifrigoris]